MQKTGPHVIENIIEAWAKAERYVDIAAKRKVGDLSQLDYRLYADDQCNIKVAYCKIEGDHFHKVRIRFPV